jgi:hypothetical protein
MVAKMTTMALGYVLLNISPGNKMLAKYAEGGQPEAM